MNKNEISQICDAFHLGNPLNDAIPIYGGLIHKMWRIDAQSGSFAIKELDATIMNRPGVHESYIQSEKIAALLKNGGIPLATALMIQDSPLYQLEELTLMVFPWVKGKTLAVKQVTAQHARQIGKIAAKMHHAELKNMRLPIPDIDHISEEHWQSLVNQAVDNRLDWALEAKKNLPHLVLWSNACLHAKQRLQKHLIISHRDMDPKNVLWSDDIKPVIIDWESAGLINPTEEILTLASEWAGMLENPYRDAIFSAVIEGYHSQGGSIIENDIQDALDGFMGNYLGWLEFNMQRSLDSSQYNTNSQKLGMEETRITFKKLNFLNDNREYFVRLVKDGL